MFEIPFRLCKCTSGLTHTSTEQNFLGKPSLSVLFLGRDVVKLLLEGVFFFWAGGSGEGVGGARVCLFVNPLQSQSIRFSRVGLFIV